MKFRTALPALILFAVQIPVGWAMWMAMIGAKRIWTQDGATEMMEISLITSLAIRLGLVIPIGMAMAAIVLLVCSLGKDRSQLAWAFGLSIAETVMLALFSLVIVEQGMRILFRMGN